MRFRVVFTGALALLLWGCSDGGGAQDAADDETLCIPGRLQCDPEGTNMLMRCDVDGMAWVDFMQCDLCHDAQCYGRLDASSG